MIGNKSYLELINFNYILGKIIGAGELIEKTSLISDAGFERDNYVKVSSE